VDRIMTAVKCRPEMHGRTVIDGPTFLRRGERQEAAGGPPLDQREDFLSSACRLARNRRAHAPDEWLLIESSDPKVARAAKTRRW